MPYELPNRQLNCGRRILRGWCLCAASLLLVSSALATNGCTSTSSSSDTSALGSMFSRAVIAAIPQWTVVQVGREIAFTKNSQDTLQVARGENGQRRFGNASSQYNRSARNSLQEDKQWFAWWNWEMFVLGCLGYVLSGFAAIVLLNPLRVETQARAPHLKIILLHLAAAGPAGLFTVVFQTHQELDCLLTGAAFLVFMTSFGPDILRRQQGGSI